MIMHATLGWASFCCLRRALRKSAGGLSHTRHPYAHLCKTYEVRDNDHLKGMHEDRDTIS